MKDTNAGVDQAYRKAISALSPGRRIVMSTHMHETAANLVCAGIRSNASRELTAEELREAFFLRMYGRDFGAVAGRAIAKSIATAGAGRRPEETQS